MTFVRTLFVGALLFLTSVWLIAAPQFPALTGRVVDNANLLSPNARASLEETLAFHEQSQGNQVVVVTVSNLQGYTIEEFGYLLGRHWGIGQKKINNGVLLIVAKDERKVRIEVGYGLEGALTDALSSNILGTKVLPYFRAGDFEQGILQGTQSILEAINGEYQPTANAQSSEQPDLRALLIFLLLLFFWLAMAGGKKRGFSDNLAILGGIILGSSSRGSGGFGSGGGFGGGFGGGGGGFGGGGASGGW